MSRRCVALPSDPGEAARVLADLGLPQETIDAVDEFREYLRRQPPVRCARCGHQPNGCPRCDRTDQFLGGQIADDRYCHTFSPQPSCYTLASREAATGGAR